MKVNGAQNVADIGTKYQSPQMLSTTRDLIGLLPVNKFFPEPKGAVEDVSGRVGRYLNFGMLAHQKIGTENNGSIDSSRPTVQDEPCTKVARIEDTKPSFEPNSRRAVSFLLKDEC